MIKITTCKKVAEKNGSILGIVGTVDRSIYMFGDVDCTETIKEGIRLTLMLNDGCALEIKEVGSEFKRNKELDDKIERMLCDLFIIKDESGYRTRAILAHCEIVREKEYLKNICGSSFIGNFDDEDYYDFIKDLYNTYMNEKKDSDIRLWATNIIKDLIMLNIENLTGKNKAIDFLKNLSYQDIISLVRQEQNNE
jgi:hypothetical protein